MDALELLKKKEFLGREFLTWLWHKIDSAGGEFLLPGGAMIRMWVGNRVMLVSDPDSVDASVVCWSEDAGLREARFALAEGKKIAEARLHYEADGEEWAFTLEAARLDLKSLKTPSTKREDGEDDAEPLALLLEKILLVQRAFNTLDGLARLFINARASERWVADEMPALTAWVAGGSRARDASGGAQ
ncbi:MAG: hypothetical protein HZA20_14295 [Nitrospirae bacterium]|nr:hypothetical protein [Nitrospirota bacterium]